VLTVAASKNGDLELPIHFVGCFDSRVTLYSQQVRSLNLIHKLLASGQVPETGSIAVIGAGAAGITAAAALALAAPMLTIDVFEAQSRILPLQHGVTGRYLRPHIYDWPLEGASEENAGLPILNWRADSAASVAAKIETEFEELRRGKNVNLYLNSEVCALKPIGKQGFEILIMAGGTARKEHYSVVLACIGFGIENSLKANINESYWSNPISTTVFKTEKYDLTLLVSGNGDGGLIDLALAALDALRHQDIEDIVLGCAGLDVIIKSLLNIENKARSALVAGNEPIDIIQAYQSEILLPNTLLRQFRDKLRRKVRIWFHTQGPQLFSLKSSILNRFIVFVILKAADGSGHIRTIIGKKLIGDPLGERISVKDGWIPKLDYRVLRFGPNRKAIQAPFNELLPELPTDPNVVPALSEGAKLRFACLAAEMKSVSSKITLDGNGILLPGLLDLMLGYEIRSWLDTEAKLTPGNYFSRSVRPNEIFKLVKIALEVTPDHPVRDELQLIYRRWYDLNPNVFRFVCKSRGVNSDSKSREVIGFTSIIPLTEKGFWDYRSGKLSEWEFGDYSPSTGLHYIAQNGSSPYRNICIQAIKLRPQYWFENSKLYWPLRSLIGTIVEHLSLLNPVPFSVKPRLIADAGRRGLHILERHGFYKISNVQSADGRPMYELNFEERAIWKDQISRLVGDRLQFLMAIEGALHIIRRHTDSQLLEGVESLGLSWDISKIIEEIAAHQRPIWQLYAVAPKQIDNASALIGELEEKLRATILFHGITTKDQAAKNENIIWLKTK
jgi:hypothetical protein